MASIVDSWLIKRNKILANKTDLYKVNLNICDTHRQYFGRMQFNFHLAYGESQQQVMLRLLASCLHASDELKIGVGACKSKEPNLYIENTSGKKHLLVLLGTPSVTQLTRACREAEHVVVLGVEDALWQRWWMGLQSKLVLLPNLSVTAIDKAVVESLMPSLQNRVRWHGLLDHETLWLHHSDGITEVTPHHLKTRISGHVQAA